MKGTDKIIKIIIFLILITSQSVSLFSSDIFDFDGNKINSNNWDSIINNNQDIIKTIPVLKNDEEKFGKKPFIVNEQGEITELKPIKTELNDGMKVNYYLIEPSTPMIWSIWCKGNQPTWAIKETYTYDVKAAGHNHNGNMPKLKTTEPALTPNEQPYYERPSPFYLPTTGSLYNNTTYYYREMMPEFSNILTEETQFLGSCTGISKDILFVKISGLVELSTGTGYILVGKTEYHPYNHFGKPDFLEQLKNIAIKWKNICPAESPLYYNDMSLTWGGLFDIYGNWKPPHKTHRKGVEADINKRTVKIGDREKFVKLMCNYLDVYTEGEEKDEAPHYHVSLRGIEITGIDERYTFCCKEKVPDECIYLYNNGNLIEEPYEQLCP